MEDIPEFLICPLTKGIMLDPVVILDSGICYDRKSLDEWIKRGNNFEPTTKKEFLENRNEIYFSHKHLKIMANDYAKKHNIIVNEENNLNNLIFKEKEICKPELIDDVDTNSKFKSLKKEHEKNEIELYFYSREQQNNVSFFSLLEKNRNEVNLEEITKLLSSGANINEKDIDGDTPLHFAAVNCNLSVIQTIVKSGAIFVKNNLNETPLDLAKLFNTKDVIEFLTNKFNVN